MKSFVVLVFVLVSAGFAQAFSTVDYCRDETNCTVAVTTDGGHVSKYCRDTYAFPCICDANTFGCDTYLSSGTCGTGWLNAGYTVTGYRCCVSKTGCSLSQLSAQPKEIVESYSADANSVQAAFDPNFTDVYFGVVDGVNRSGNAGRANSIHTRLDICLGNTDVDTVTSTGWNAYGEGQCESSYCGITSKNEYCNANSAAVCKDRCTCLYGYHGVTGIPTCQNL